MLYILIGLLIINVTVKQIKYKVLSRKINNAVRIVLNFNLYILSHIILP